MPALRAASFVLALCFAWPVQRALAHARFPAVLRLAFDRADDRVVVASTTFGLLYTDDGGAIWRYACASSAGAGDSDVPAVVLDDDGAWEVGLVSGAWRTADRGCSFDDAAGALSGVFVSDLRVRSERDAITFAVTSSSLQDNRLYAAPGGEAFEPRGPSFGAELLRTLRIAPSDPNVIYVSGARPAKSVDELRSATVHRSDDGGATFTSYPFALDWDGFEVLVMAVDPRDPQRIYAVQRRVGREPLLRSDDGGATFHEIFAAPGPLLGVALDASGETIWVGGELSGLFRSRDGGPFETVREDLQVLCLEHAWDELWVCDGSLTSGFQVGRSSDGGDTFSPVLRFAELERSFSCEDDARAEALCGAEIDDVLAELSLFRGLVEAEPARDAGGGAPSKARGCATVARSSREGTGELSVAVALLAVFALRLRRASHVVHER